MPRNTQNSDFVIWTHLMTAASQGWEKIASVCVHVGWAPIAMNKTNLVFEEKGCKGKSLQMLKLTIQSQRGSLWGMGMGAGEFGLIILVFFLKSCPQTKLGLKSHQLKQVYFCPFHYSIWPLSFALCILALAPRARTPSLWRYRTVINSFHWAADYSWSFNFLSLLLAWPIESFQ